jgi:hypothetical protein
LCTQHAATTRQHCSIDCLTCHSVSDT